MKKAHTSPSSYFFDKCRMDHIDNATLPCTLLIASQMMPLSVLSHAKTIWQHYGLPLIYPQPVPCQGMPSSMAKTGWPTSLSLVEKFGQKDTQCRIEKGYYIPWNTRISRFTCTSSGSTGESSDPRISRDPLFWTVLHCLCWSIFHECLCSSHQLRNCGWCGLLRLMDVSSQDNYEKHGN